MRAFKSDYNFTKINNSLISNAGNGGDGMDLEPRVAKIEANIEHINKSVEEIKLDLRVLRSDMNNSLKEIHSDMKHHFFWLLGTIFALGAIMAHGFHWF